MRLNFMKEATLLPLLILTNQWLKQQRLNLIYCIGNSIVHLESLNELALFFKNTKSLLNSQGKIIIQIINYNRIIKKGIKKLPDIINEKAKLHFERNYNYDSNKQKIAFNTVLTVNNNKISNTIYLTPIFASEINDILLDCGFKNIQFYGDFKFSPYIETESYALVLVASTE